MTIEEKVREIVRTAINNSLSVDKTTQAILDLIKPMSREKLIKIIMAKHIYVTGVCDTDKFAAVPIKGLANAILAEWGKGA